MPEPTGETLTGASSPRRRLARWLIGLVGARPPLRTVVSVALVVATAVLLLSVWPRASGGDELSYTVRRDSLVEYLSEQGTLRPAQSLVYRSPLNGREAEIVFLAPEGVRVGEGDLLVRLETSELADELERAGQTLRQTRVDGQVSELERLAAEAALASIVDGEGALGLEEDQTNLRLAERRVERLRGEFESLAPLLDRGLITREELQRSQLELEAAEADLNITRRRMSVLRERTHPLDRQRAELQLAQRRAQEENVRQRVAEAERRVVSLGELIDGSSLYARRPGLVVYEEHMASSPRRKIRVGDRVTPSQGIVQIPEVDHMLVASSVREADMHRVQIGMPVAIALEAFPDARLSGRVASIGTLAREPGRVTGDSKRFDLLVELAPSGVELRPEMTARVDILIAERHDALLLPINAVFEAEGATVAIRLGPLGAEARRLALDASNDRFVEVLSGLDEHDRVRLAAPGSSPSASSGAGADRTAGALFGNHGDTLSLEPR